MDRKGRVDIGIREFRKGKKERFRFFLQLSAKVVTLSVVVSVAILGWQSYTWTQSAVWPPVSLTDAFAVVGVNLQGLGGTTADSNLAIFGQILLDLPATLMLPLLTTLFFAFASWFL